MSTRPTRATKAKPCPFCGTGHIWLKQNKTTILECNGCHAFMINYIDGEERDVVAAWNRRYEQPNFNQTEENQ